MNTQAETWLFLDDTSVDRRHMRLAVDDLHQDVRLILAATMTEAKELLEKEDVSVFLTDFYLRNGLTTGRMISEVRAAFPRLPIVVVSGQTANQDAPYSAGADSVIPKLESLPEFSKSIASAVRHAKLLRSLDHRDNNNHNIFIPEDISTDVMRMIRRPVGNVLISAESGMGRTSLARHLALQIIEQHSKQFHAGVHAINCRQKSMQAPEFEELFFGSANLRSARVVGLLEKAQDGILIIDDAEHLPAALQLSLKNIWEQGSAHMRNGALIRTSRIFMILTTQKSELKNRSESFERGFLQTVVVNKIPIPDFFTLKSEYSEIANFIVEKQQSKMTAAPEFYNQLMQLLCASPLRVTFRSLSKTIQCAADAACFYRRSILMASDLQDAALLYENLPSKKSTKPREDFSFVDSSEPVSDDQWRELADTIRTGTVQQAQSLLMNMMLTYASVRFNNNKAKIADALGLGRATLYRSAQVNLSSQRGTSARQVDSPHASEEGRSPL